MRCWGRRLLSQLQFWIDSGGPRQSSGGLKPVLSESQFRTRTYDRWWRWWWRWWWWWWWWWHGRGWRIDREKSRLRTRGLSVRCACACVVLLHLCWWCLQSQDFYFDTRCAFSVAHQTHKQLECRSGPRARVHTGKNISWKASAMQHWTYSRLCSRIAEEANNCVGVFRDVRWGVARIHIFAEWFVLRTELVWAGMRSGQNW